MSSMPPTPLPSETVSQSEIERLLAMVGGGDTQMPADAPIGKNVPSVHSHLPRHEFPQLSSFSQAELRKLRVRHEDYIHNLAARLSMHIRLECNLQMSKLESVSFQQFVDGMSSPTHLTLLKIEPLNGICFLDIPLRLGLCIVDREMGGSARITDNASEMGKLETRLLSRIVDIIGSEWCSTFSNLLDLRPIQIRQENNPRFLQVYPPGCMMLVLGVEMKIGEVSEQVQLGLPYSTLAPLMLKLNADTACSDKPAQAKPSAQPVRWNQALDDMKMQVTAELPEVELEAGVLANLKVGDFIPLTASVFSQIQVRLADSPRFTGIIGTSGDQVAVKLVQLLKS